MHRHANRDSQSRPRLTCLAACVFAAGTVPLVLLCFFPTPDVAKSTEDLPLIWK